VRLEHLSLAPHKLIEDPLVGLPCVAFAADFYKIPQAADWPAAGCCCACLIDDTYFIAVVERPANHAIGLRAHVGRRVIVASAAPANIATGVPAHRKRSRGAGPCGFNQPSPPNGRLFFFLGELEVMPRNLSVMVANLSDQCGVGKP
jgi:hypothetical protein